MTKNSPPAKTVVLIVAAGRGERVGGSVPKQYRFLQGKPVLRRTAEAFLNHPMLPHLQVVHHPQDKHLYDQAMEGLNLLPPVPGGATRQDSVRRGLEALAASEFSPEYVLIHDAARPFVSTALIDRVIAGLTEADGIIPILPVTDTMKQIDHKGQVTGTADRNQLARAQTPQGFAFPVLLKAHRAFRNQALTDDAAVAEAYGLTVKTVAGEEKNVKLTTLADFERMERIVLENSQPRIGQGYDVHRFGEGDHVMLCGVRIPHAQGLIGHSDADVGLHALTDALLGAVGAGDIGQHFSPSNPQWRGASSRLFVEKARTLVEQHDGRIINVDITLICETPKIGPWRTVMRKTVADLLQLADNQVNVKATTTEGLGFTGRREGIAAQVVVLVQV